MLGKTQINLPLQGDKKTTLSLGCRSSHREAQVPLLMENPRNTGNQPSGKASGLLGVVRTGQQRALWQLSPFPGRGGMQGWSCLQGALAENIRPQQITSTASPK